MPNPLKLMMAAAGAGAGYALWAWGDGIQGAQGQGDSTDRSSPVQVGDLTTWSGTTLGHTTKIQNTSHAIKADGTLWGWGSNGQGRIGDGTATGRNSPVQIGSLTNWAFLNDGAESRTKLAVKTDGTLWAWGRNGDGQEGDGTVIDKSSPIQIGSLTTWLNVSSGGKFTASVKTDGTLWTWGKNEWGQLGDGTKISRSSPVQVGASTDWATTSCSEDATRAIKTDGTLWSWGKGIKGQLGHGNTVYLSSPVQVGSLTDWAGVYGSKTSTIARKTNGTLWSWGHYADGVLGHGNANPSSATSYSSPVQIGSLTNWSVVTTGPNFVGVVKTDGTLWTWGSNSPNGQLGLGTVVNVSSPIQVGTDTNWVTVAAGYAGFIGIKS
jgi:alpha-tubulin suppressor-like RCC1 family protein